MEDIRTYSLRRLLEGASHEQIARELGVTKNTITGQVTRARRAAEKAVAARPVELQPTPPSAAMLRLAAFDPVIARAARDRTVMAA